MRPIIAGKAFSTMLCEHALAKKAFVAIASPLLELPAPVMNSPEDGPTGMPAVEEPNWWKDSDLVRKIRASEEQIKKIERIVRAQQIFEIKLLAYLEKQYAVLRFQMKADPPDETQVLAQIDKIAKARIRLERSQVKVLRATRRVFTAKQTTIMRDLQRPADPPASELALPTETSKSPLRPRAYARGPPPDNLGTLMETQRPFVARGLLASTRFQYQDVGVSLELTPHLLASGEVAIHAKIEISTLGADVSVAGVSEPTFGQRVIEHDIRLREGEVNLLGGLLQSTQTSQVQGVPGLGSLPFVH